MASASIAHSSADYNLRLPFVSNSSLEKRTMHIRTRPVPWEGYQKAALITETELGLLRCYERRVPEDNARYAALFISLLQKLVRVDTIQHILVLIDDMLEDSPDKAQLFLRLDSGDPRLPYEPLFSCLDKDDEYLSTKAAKILTFFICAAGNISTKDLSALFSWIISKIAVTRGTDQPDIATQLLAALLRVRTLRQAFYDTPRGVSTLTDALRRYSTNPQMQYQIIVCLWLLSFETDIAQTIDREHEILSLLIGVAKNAIKEKVVRVCAATFRNLVDKALEENIGSMLVHRLLPCCEQLSTRKFQDTDIYEDVKAVCEQLQQEFLQLSSFDAYVTELESGRLDWTPVHTSETFWQQNFQRFSENDYAYLKALAALLATDGPNPTVLAVAAHDIGQYVKYCVPGKHVVQEIGAKHRIMELMVHEDKDVRYHALLAVQKYMTSA